MIKRRMMVAKIMNVDSNDTICHDQLCNPTMQHYSANCLVCSVDKIYYQHTKHLFSCHLIVSIANQLGEGNQQYVQ